MSGRFVRASKYRHVHGEPARKDKCYNSVRANADGDGNNIKANKRFMCFSGVGGGGPVVVHDLKKIDRLPNPCPAINVHKAKVLDFDFNPFLDNLLATAGEDNHIKITLFPEDGLVADVTEAAASLEGHLKKVSIIHWHPVANNIMSSAAYDNTVRVWDVSNSKELMSFELPEVAQSAEWNHNGSQILVTCKDKTIRIFDPRKPGAAQSTPGFAGAKPSRGFWADNHNMFGAVGFSVTSTRQYSLFDPRKMDKSLVTEDIDQSAGNLIPFYDPDNSVLYIAGKGDAGIKYFELVDEAPYIHFLSEFRHNESQRGLCFLPKLAMDTATCEIALALRLMKDMIQPVSFQVPRKSDIFQADIYPDAYAGVAALTASEWWEGKDKEPPTTSMKDKKVHADAGASAGPKFVAQKSNAELQKELAEAHAKIAQLEAELAKLKAK